VRHPELGHDEERHHRGAAVTPGLEILSPEGAVATAPVTAAPPVSTLTGRSIAVLDNGKPNARQLLTRIAERLAERTNAEVSIVAAKATAAEPAEPDILRQLEAAQVVVTGSAD
jgi:hypothetical protein